MRSHPGFHFSHLAELKLHVIPKNSLPSGKLCDIRLLKLTKFDVDETTREYREYYSKMALLIFYPFRTLDNLKIGCSYWRKFRDELDEYTKETKAKTADKEEFVENINFRKRGLLFFKNFKIA